MCPRASVNADGALERFERRGHGEALGVGGHRAGGPGARVPARPRERHVHSQSTEADNGSPSTMRYFVTFSSPSSVSVARIRVPVGRQLNSSSTYPVARSRQRRRPPLLTIVGSVASAVPLSGVCERSQLGVELARPTPRK